MYFINVGQGDLSFLSTAKNCLFFDAGGDAFKIGLKAKSLLQKECSHKKNTLFLSHFDRDHIIKTFDLIRIISIQHIYVPYFEPKSELARKLLQYIKRVPSLALSDLRAPQTVSTEEYKIRCLAPLKASAKNPENNNSLVLELTVLNRKFLITGDAPVKPQLLSEPVEVLKVSHHGSRHNSSKEIMRKARPLLCIVSVGAKNKYGHPHIETLEILNKGACAVLRTDRLGTIEIDL